MESLNNGKEANSNQTQETNEEETKEQTSGTKTKFEKLQELADEKTKSMWEAE